MSPGNPLAYRLLLLLLPPAFRQEYGAELGAVLGQRLREARGVRGRAWVWAVTVFDVLTSALPEWSRALREESLMSGARSSGMDEVIQNLRYTMRSLAKSPAFAVVAMLTLALGIGANSAIFSVVNAVLLRPLPYQDPDRVIRVKAGWAGEFGNWLSQPEIVDIDDEVPSIAEVGSWTESSSNLTGADAEPERVRAVAIMPQALELLGASLTQGRVFTADEGTSGNDGVVVLSDALFQRRFGGDPSLIGKAIEVNGRSRTVVGVLSPQFRLLTDFRGSQTEVFAPLIVNRENLEGRGSHGYHTVARLAPGATLEQVQSELDALTARLTEAGEYHAEAKFGFQAVRASDDVLGNVTPALGVLLGAVGFVLLIACANVANLLLARGEERQREMSVRAAMGADRPRIVRQLLTESVVLALVGGALGVGVAFLGTRFLLAISPSSLPRAQGVTVDGPVLVFTLGIAVLTGVIFGLAPALQAARHDPQAGLRESTRSASASRRRQAFRRLLAVSELAFAVVLLIGAGLMVRTFQSLRAVDVGFDSDGILSMTLSLPTASYPDNAAVIDFYDRLLRDVQAVPGVERAAAVRILPLTSTIGDWSIDLEDYEEQPGDNPKGDWQTVTPGYFEVMGLELLEGRLLEPTDDQTAPPVVVVNKTMADAYWPDGALGKRFRAGSQREWTTVVGVVEDVSRNALVDEPRTEMYHPHAQYPRTVTAAPRTMTMVVKATGGRAPQTLFAPIRDVVRTLNPNLPISDVRTVQDVLDSAVAEQRFMMTLLSIFGGLAVLLAVVGIYGVQQYSVSRRVHEIGIRMALGAGRNRVLGLVLRESMGLVGLGLLLGTGLALGLTQAMSAMLYGVRATDPLTFLAVPVLLGAFAIFATWLPAQRATGVPPTEALKSE
jgi:putative ABC transport system permease protein